MCTAPPAGGQQLVLLQKAGLALKNETFSAEHSAPLLQSALARGEGVRGQRVGEHSCSEECWKAAVICWGQVVETAPGEAAEELKRVPALFSATVSLVLSHIKEVNSECGLNM